VSALAAARRPGAARARAARAQARVSCLYEGAVRHRRRGLAASEFRYPLFMVYLDLDELPGCLDGHWLWSARRPALARFRRSDYLGDRTVALEDAVRALVRERTGIAVDGPIRLLTHLRYFGHSFNPVSFYYCYDAAGEHVRAVVAEVTNTPWGERHAYVMAVSESEDHGSAAVISAHLAKQLHVSPLMGMDQIYHWRLTPPAQRLSLHIESRRHSGESIFDATLALRRVEIDRRSLTRALIRYPLLSVRILARIYGHALRLRLRGARYFPHPRDGRTTR